MFFDLPADRYFLLTLAAAESFGRFVSGAANAADHACLLAHNLLAESVQTDVPDGDRLSAVTASLVDTPRADASLGSAIASISSLVTRIDDFNSDLVRMGRKDMTAWVRTQMQPLDALRFLGR